MNNEQELNDTIDNYIKDYGDEDIDPESVEKVKEILIKLVESEES